jgi:hypothetical protein
MGIKTYRHAIAWVALVALLLRGLIPAGFMPRPAHSAADAHLIICTGEGARLILGDQGGAPLNSSLEHKPCIFAPVSPLAEAPQIPLFAFAQLDVRSILFPVTTAPSARVLSLAHAARAPPILS